MKKQIFQLMGLLTLSFILFGCTDLCKDLTCENNGTCFEGTCNCTQAWTGPQCEIPKCDVLYCQNGGVCWNGECECPIGYYGEVCEFQMRNNFVGTWNAIATCVLTGGTEETQAYTLNITEGNSILEIMISNLEDNETSIITGYVEEEDRFIFGGQNLNGEGSRFGSNKLELNYISYSGQSRDCAVILTRQ